MGSHRPPLQSQQSKREQFGSITLAADRDDNVLFSVQHICHRRARLACGHVDGSNFFTRLLVVGAQHRTNAAVGCGEGAGLAGNQQCLRYEKTNRVGLTASARNVEAFQSRMVADIIRRLGISNPPEDFALIHIDCDDTAVRRLHQRQALNT